jgi:hypothetical protein
MRRRPCLVLLAGIALASAAGAQSPQDAALRAEAAAARAEAAATRSEAAAARVEAAVDRLETLLRALERQGAGRPGDGGR